MDPIPELIDVLTRSRALEPQIAASGEVLVACLRAGGKILSCGNGGSAADALHLAEELVGRYHRARRALPAISLSADGTALTCIGNDFGFDQVFARQIEALARPGDVVVAFTTSGNSPNLLQAFTAAQTAGAKTILLAGKGGGQARGRCDYELIIPSDNGARVQEVHTLVLHSWLDRVDAEFCR